MFDFRQLRYFIAVAEELSFTRAAQRLHISQPPLSQQIQSLEQDLEVVLFKRNKRTVALTEPGRVFLEQARQILARSEEARRAVSEAAAGFNGRMRVAYADSLCVHPIIGKVLLGYRSMACKASMTLVEMDSKRQLDALSLGDLDAGFVRDMPSCPDVTQSFRLDIVDREPLLVALPCAHRLAGRQRLTMMDLCRETFVVQSLKSAHSPHKRILLLASHAGFQPVIRRELVPLGGLLALVAAGFGITVVPASLRVAKIGGVVYLPLHAPEAYLPVAVVSRMGDESPALAQFLSLVQDAANGDLPITGESSGSAVSLSSIVPEKAVVDSHEGEFALPFQVGVSRSGVSGDLIS
ncbi:LysR substrate-binding domain-containing protein [Xanthomonas campestris pv. fici]|uniref:LysR substrate-binding domain-containing protein n=1 Tax=Xanthomonas euvesicatoria TaxID=456327 RepID=UPI0035565261